MGEEEDEEVVLAEEHCVLDHVLFIVLCVLFFISFFSVCWVGGGSVVSVLGGGKCVLFYLFIYLVCWGVWGWVFLSHTGLSEEDKT